MGKGKGSLMVFARVRTNNIIIFIYHRLLLLPFVVSFHTSKFNTGLWHGIFHVGVFNGLDVIGNGADRIRKMGVDRT